MAVPGIRLGAIDLNLLVVFDAISRERGVTRAAHLIGLSQPAVSHALARLRHMLKDELFVRGPRGMSPTPRAEELATPVRQALDGLRQALEPLQAPSEAARAFRIAMDNYSALVLTGPLARRMTRTAPGATAEFLPSGTLNIADQLDHGDLDLAVGVHASMGERFSRRPLLEDDFVAVTRNDHPAAARDGISASTFASLPNLEISSIHVPTDFVDEALAKADLTRRIALRVPFLAAARILAESDMVSVFPRRMAMELVGSRPLTVHALPFASPRLEVAMIWPQQLNNLAAHRWLRDAMIACRDSLTATPSMA